MHLAFSKAMCSHIPHVRNKWKSKYSPNYFWNSVPRGEGEKRRKSSSEVAQRSVIYFEYISFLFHRNYAEPYLLSVEKKEKKSSCDDEWGIFRLPSRTTSQALPPKCNETGWPTVSSVNSISQMKVGLAVLKCSPGERFTFITSQRGERARQQTENSVRHQCLKAHFPT